MSNPADDAAHADCDECTRLTKQEQKARADFDYSAATDARVKLAWHQETAHQVLTARR